MSDAMMFGIATMPYEMAMSDEMSRRQFYANTQRLVAALEAAQMGLRREESDHERTIDQRDAAEDALSRMFQAVTGRPAEWSSAWGYVDAIEEVEEHVATLATERDQLAAALEAARAEVDALRKAVVRADLQIGDGHIEAARITLHDAMDAALEAAREDAERYRWLRDREIPEWLDLWHQNPDRIDDAIDAAIVRERGKGER